jgi:hypothetical protein
MDTIRRRYAAAGRKVLTLQAPRSLSISHFLVKKKTSFVQVSVRQFATPPCPCQSGMQGCCACLVVGPWKMAPAVGGYKHVYYENVAMLASV